MTPILYFLILGMKSILSWLRSNSGFRCILLGYALFAGMVVVMGYVPAWITHVGDERLLFGLFELTLIDDITHGITALAFFVALFSPGRKLGILALTAFGYYYALDAIFYLAYGFFNGGGYIPDILLNFLHVVISSTMLYFSKLK
jgi:hypothetical protein